MLDFEQQIGPFRLYSEVGRTPISNKYRATDSRSGETVALHILTTDAAQQPAVVQQFLTIGRRAMRLRHPGIVPIVDTGEAQGFVYVATQWVRGQSLGERLRHTGRTVDIETAAYVINALAATLDYAHSQGFTHGHITLDQIYITDDNVIMLDGFAEAVRLTSADNGQNGKVLGETITNPLVFISPFIAPEQAQSGNNFDFRVDIYSLGAVLYTMLLGQPPFVAEESGELLAQIVERQPAPPEFINPSLPAAMVYVLKLVLAKDPAMRYASAGEFANAFLQSSQWYAITPVDENVDADARRGFAPMLIFSLVALLSFVIIVGVGFGWLGDRFAFLQRSDGTGLLAQVGDLWPQTAIPGRAMDASTDLTPVLLLTATPSAQSTVLSTVTTTSEAVAQISGIAESPAISATTMDVTATVALATPIVVEVPVLAATPTLTDTANPSEAASSLVIDPFGLLVDAVTAGEVAINGTAVPGTSIQLQVNGRNSGSTTTKTTGTWSFIVSLEQPGDYVLIAQMLDGNGGVTATTQRTVTVTNGAEAQTNILTATATITATITTPVVVPATATPTALSTVTPTATPTVTPTTTPSMTNTSIPPTVAPTATPSMTNTSIPPTVTFTRTPTPTAIATNTATSTPIPPTATFTRTSMPTATFTNTPVPTATATNTPVPTVTLTQTPVPTSTTPLQPTATRTPLPTVTATRTPLPTVTATRTPLPTATFTKTALPTATVTNTATNTATNTPQPTATNTPTPTATNTPRPTATNTPRPTATDTPQPTMTNTPLLLATATNTPRQIATNTLRSTATNTNTPKPTLTNTPVPTPLPPPTNTRPPTATNTPEPTATPTAVVGVIDPSAPANGESGGGQRVFSWSANFTPPPDTAFELVFWKPGQDPIANSIGLAAPTTNLNVTLDLERLDEQLGALFDTGEYNWGVLLVRTTPTYERVKYLGGGRTFTYYRGGSSSSSGPSSGE